MVKLHLVLPPSNLSRKADIIGVFKSSPLDSYMFSNVKHTYSVDITKMQKLEAVYDWLREQPGPAGNGKKTFSLFTQQGQLIDNISALGSQSRVYALRWTKKVLDTIRYENTPYTSAVEAYDALNINKHITSLSVRPSLPPNSPESAPVSTMSSIQPPVVEDCLEPIANGSDDLNIRIIRRYYKLIEAAASVTDQLGILLVGRSLLKKKKSSRPDFKPEVCTVGELNAEFNLFRFNNFSFNAKTSVALIERLDDRRGGSKSTGAIYAVGASVHDAIQGVLEFFPSFFHLPLPKFQKYFKLLFSDGTVFSLKPFDLVEEEDVVTHHSFIPRMETESRDVTINQTDGCGKVSQQLLDEIIQNFMQTNRNAEDLDPRTVEALQFRFQGFKGVLYLDPSLEGRQLVVRPSMKKFQKVDVLRNFINVLHLSKVEEAKMNVMLALLLFEFGLQSEVRNIIFRNIGKKIHRRDWVFAEPKKPKFKVDCIHFCKGVVDNHWFANVRLASLKVSHFHPPDCSSLRIEDGFVIGKALLYRYPGFSKSDILPLEFVKRENSPLNTIVFPINETIVPTGFHLAGGDFDGDDYFFIHDEEIINKVYDGFEGDEFQPSFNHNQDLSTASRATTTTRSSLKYNLKPSNSGAGILYNLIIECGVEKAEDVCLMYYRALDGKETPNVHKIRDQKRKNDGEWRHLNEVEDLNTIIDWISEAFEQ
ncbi:hypothetical protein P9112_004247 [Eukaryota sp. TZLM1-RC]